MSDKEREPMDLVTCELCGMSWTRMMYLSLDAMEDGVGAIERPPHECPEPYSREIAQGLLDFHRSSRIPMHPRLLARCRLAFKEDVAL